MITAIICTVLFIQVIFQSMTSLLHRNRLGAKYNLLHSASEGAGTQGSDSLRHLVAELMPEGLASVRF